jgi:hypothetical protein
MGFAVLTLLAVSQAPSRKIAVVGLAGSAAVLAVLVWQLTGVDGELLGEAVARSVATESVSERRRFLEVGLAAIEQDPVFGTGSASLLRQELPHPTAHNVYVSWLARFGVMGGALYFTFLFVPLTFVLVRNVVPAGQRWLVIFTALPLLVMYVSYDFFPFLEYQYLLFGLWYTILLRQTIMPPSPSNSSPQADSRTKLPFQTQARGPNSAARDSLSPIVGHWKVIGLIAAAVTVLGAVAGSIVPPVWEATGLIRVGQVTTLGVGSSPVEPPQRTIARMRSRSFGERVLKAVSMSPDPRDPETALFWSSFTVAPYRDSDALIVKVRARSPELANQLAEAATEAISELHSELWTATVEVSKRHLAQKRTELEELKRKRDSLRERMRQANSSRAADVYTNMFLLTMLTQTDVEIRGAEQWLAQLQEMFTPIRTYPTSELASVRVSDTPVSPKRLAIIILSCVAGSLIGLLVALGLEWRRKLGEA